MYTSYISHKNEYYVILMIPPTIRRNKIFEWLSSEIEVL